MSSNRFSTNWDMVDDDDDDDGGGMETDMNTRMDNEWMLLSFDTLHSPYCSALVSR